MGQFLSMYRKMFAKMLLLEVEVVSKLRKKTTHIFQLTLVVVGCAVGATHWHVDLRAHLGTF